MSKSHEVMLSPSTLEELKHELIETPWPSVTVWVEPQAEWFEETGNITDKFPMGILKWMDKLVDEVTTARREHAGHAQVRGVNRIQNIALSIKLVSQFRTKKTMTVTKQVIADDYQIVVNYPRRPMHTKETLKKPSVTVTTTNRKTVITEDLLETFSPDGVVCVDRWALALGPKGLYWAHAFHREGIYDDTTYCPAKAEDARVRTHGLIRKWAGMGDSPLDESWKKFFWYCHTHPDIRGKMALPAQEELMRQVLAQMAACSNPRPEEVVAFAAWVIQKEIDMGVTALTTNVTKQGWGTAEIGRGEMTYEKYLAQTNLQLDSSSSN